jgi:5-methylcytosine-specific restriction endonuclease McrA
MKTCSKCKEHKSFDHFQKDSQNIGGYKGVCKVCRSKYEKEYAQKNKEKIQNYGKSYYQKNREAITQKTKIYAAKNKLKIAERSRQYRQNNADTIRLKQASYYEKNKEAVKQRVKDYRKQYPEKKAELKHRARARMIDNGIYKISNKFLKRLYQSPCVMCKTTEDISADHVIPIARGGRHSEGNLQPLCRSCNSSKNAKTMSEWKLFIQKSAV